MAAAAPAGPPPAMTTSHCTLIEAGQERFQAPGCVLLRRNCFFRQFSFRRQSPAATNDRPGPAFPIVWEPSPGSPGRDAPESDVVLATSRGILRLLLKGLLYRTRENP